MTSSFLSVGAESEGLPVPEGQDFGTSSNLDLLDLHHLDHLLVPFEDSNHHQAQLEVQTSQAASKSRYLTDHFDGNSQAHSLPADEMDEAPLTCACHNTSTTIARRANHNNQTMRQSAHCKPALPTTIPQMSNSQEYPPYLRSSVGLGYSTGMISRTPSSGVVSNIRHAASQNDGFSQPGSDYIDPQLDQPRLFQCKWEDCPYRGRFTKLPALWRHIQSTHISPEEYNCPECGKTFGLGRGDKFKLHMKVTHSRLASNAKDGRYYPF